MQTNEMNRLITPHFSRFVLKLMAFALLMLFLYQATA